MTIFLYGPNTYALRQHVASMIVAYCNKTGSNFGLDRIDGATAKPRELVATLQASPFLSSSRLVIVEGLSHNRAAGEKLANALATVPESTVAVFVEPNVDQRTALFKLLSGADKVMKFEELQPPQLLSWCQQEIKKHGGTADRAAINELIGMAGGDQWRLSGEIGKLVNYDSIITTETVRKLVAPSLDQSIFDLTEAMTSGRADVALAAYRKLLAARESELYILTMIQWQLRNLLLAKTAPGLTAAELAKTAGISPYVATKALAAHKRYDETMLRADYLAAANCEEAIKSGKLKAEPAVEQLIFKVATNS